MEMVIRRQTDPIHVKNVWNAIRTANYNRVSADVGKITKYLQSIDDYTPEQVELYIKQILSDKLIAPVKKIDPSSPHQIYKIPIQDESFQITFDGKDWYCFECHLAGDVIECTNCFRVFHQKCITSGMKRFEEQRTCTDFSVQNITRFATEATEPSGSSSRAVTIIDEEEPRKGTSNVVDKSKLAFDSKLCSICNLQRIDTTSSMGKSEINYLLKFVLHRIRAWLPNTITRTIAAEDHPDWLSDSELTWRANQLFCEHTDMSVIEVKLNTETYTKLADFLGDVLTIYHNVTIFHGTKSQEFGAAELMLRDTLYDLAEMRNCFDCYKHSNEKCCAKWFCLPCRVPHKLVWAKQKGYPYWPAKVMRINDNNYDVRFFGGKYERALLTKSLIKPIDVPKDNLMIKESNAFNKAFNELRYHQRLLRDPVELERLLAESKPKRKLLYKPKSITPKTQVPKKSKTIKTSVNSKQTKNSKPTTSKKSLDTSTQVSKLGLSHGSHKRKRREKESDFIHVEGIEERKRKVSSDVEANSTFSGNNVIDISDGEIEDCEEYSYRHNNSAESFSLDESFEQVTSSTENFGKMLSPKSESGMQPLDQPYSDSVEKMRRKLECLPNKKEIIKCAMDCMQIEIDKITNDHNEHLKRLFESHNQQISETKKKQWCYNCEQDAIYHCCWNTAYCSQTCQQQHWQAEHKKVCRRKR
ncbi:zinc finger MYND domain-containing protein 11 isoform X1 [Diorhabda sublineata]|uniref:zinc finger MYND domain-containing protein 11 isoform X1 n=2 Tax=Diorhabda sublineata TaxID=1163346 RepID=UPI0024E0E596|nr:zinc finger MYND domain-containing protein 11 isoform X1 [Diorhabda sublineata]